MKVVFPIFIQDKDKWIYMINGPLALNGLEIIDINNNEYVGWDKDGRPIELYVDNNDIKARCLSDEKQVEILKKAIMDYAAVARRKAPFCCDDIRSDMVVLFKAVEQHINNHSVFNVLKRVLRSNR